MNSIITEYHLSHIKNAAEAMDAIGRIQLEISIMKVSEGGAPEWWTNRIEGGLAVAIGELADSIEGNAAKVLEALEKENHPQKPYAA